MPSTEIVEKIHEQLIPLGDEPAVAAARGEIVEPPPRPSQSLDDDLSALLADTEAESEAISQQQRDGEQSDEADSTELLSRLDSLFDDEEAGGEGAVEDTLSDLDLGDEDFPAPADFSFDPDTIPDELPEDFDAALADTPSTPDSPDGADAPDDTPTIDGSDDRTGLFDDEEPMEDGSTDETAQPSEGDDDVSALLEESDADILAAFGEDIDADPLADLAALHDEADGDGGSEPGDDAELGVGELGGVPDLDDGPAAESDDASPGAIEGTDAFDDLSTEEVDEFEGAEEAEALLGDLSETDVGGADATQGEDPFDIGVFDDVPDSGDDFAADAALDDLVGDGVSEDDTMTDGADALEDLPEGDAADLGESPGEGVSEEDFDLGDLGDLGETEGPDDDDLFGSDDMTAEEPGTFGDSTEEALEGDESAGASDFDIGEFGESPDAIDDFDVDTLGDLDLDTSADDGEALDGGDLFGADDDLSEGDSEGFDESLGGGADDSDFDIEAVGEPSDAIDDIDDADGSTDDTASAFEDLGDVDGGSLSDSFGSDFGSQMDEDFGDIELDEGSSAGDVAPFSGADDIDFSGDGASLDDLDALDEDGFSLGDFGEEFDIREDSIDEFAGLDVDTDGIEEEDEEGEEAVHGAVDELDRELSDEQFLRLRKTLASLPLNVKIAAEECIGEGKGSREGINELIDLLVGGASPVKIADHLSKTIGKKLEVPKGYQKRSGLAFEEQQQTFRYRFQHVILPMLRTALLIGLATAVVGLLSYRFIYQPIHAAILYQRGYEYALQDRYQLANETFFRAWQLRPRDRWFIEYAELFVEKRQYQLAVEKYDELVFGMDESTRGFLRRMVSERRLIESVPVGPRDRRQIFDLLNVNREAILAHGALQSEVLASYERADELYSIILFGDEYDYDALLARGDNFMRWAEERPERYEDARLAYAGLLARYGDTDEILMRFLRYFVRTDNAERVGELVDLFERQSPEAEIHPEIYAEAAGFLMDRGRIVDIREMLIRSYRSDPLVPEVHYELARFNRIVEAPIQERAALDNAREAFALAEPLSRRRLIRQVDTDIRSGEFWFERDEFLQARGDFDAARRRYETARESGFIAAEAHLARLYARLADLEFFQGGDLEYALDRYNRAAQEGYETDELNYKRGFIHFVAGRFDQAVDRFYDIGPSNALVGPDTVIYARANTLFLRENFFGAEAFYRELLSRLDARRDAIPTLLVDENPAHRALVQNLIRVNNNLGVTLFRISERDVTQEARLSEGLSLLTESAELSENYLRREETGERAAATNLAFLNIRDILYPAGDFEPRIYEQLPRDITQELF